MNSVFYLRVWFSYLGFSPVKIHDRVGGRGLGGVCDHINHFGHHIKEMWLLKAWGATMLKGPGENTELLTGMSWPEG